MLDRVVISETAWDTVYNFGLDKEVNKLQLTQLKHSLPRFRMFFGGDSEIFFDVTTDENRLQVFTVHQETNRILDYFDIVTVDGVDMVQVSDEYEKVFNHFTPGADYGAYCQDVSFFFKSLIVYMAEYREVKERIRKATKGGHSKKKKNKRQSKKPIKFGVYYINDYHDPSENKECQRHTESWSVRGHWRNFKSGMKTWIAQYDKGTGTKQSKLYTVG